MPKLFAVILFFMTGYFGAQASEIDRNHPDGTVGKPSACVSIGYSDIKTVPKDVANDRKLLTLGIGYPIFPNFTFYSGLGISSGDTLFYDYYLGAKIYPRNPGGDDIKCNPDGLLWVPVLNFEINGMFPDTRVNDNSLAYKFSLLIPLSANFSAKAGTNIYQEESPYQVDKYFCGLNIFPRRYLPGKCYENPDGVEGIPSFSITAGGSEYGFEGTINILVPFNRSTTVIFTAHGERTADPYKRTAMIKIGLNYYPDKY